MTPRETTETTTPVAAPEKPQRLSGAQRRKDTRPRTLQGGVWRLNIWRPHPRVARGRPRSEVSK
jgi:hypothetical protein